MSLAQNKKSRSSDLHNAINELKDKMAEETPHRQAMIENLVNNMTTEVNSYAADFAINKIGEERHSKELYEHSQNIELKKLYLFQEILKLEKIQIAESIMQIESLPGQQNMFKITFDSTIINEQMEMNFEELSKLNNLREYSLFGIHKTVPNSPYPYFSYFKELDALCKDPEFKFEFSMPYNNDPKRFDTEVQAKKHHKSGVKNSAELMMCHHCKVLLPESSFFVCSKKCKCLQSEPCKVYLS
jgi:hypothetical protein